MTTTTTDTITAPLDELLAAGYAVTYAADQAWDGCLYADLLDSHGRRWQCGSGATETEALADLLRRLDRDGWPETGAAETPGQLREALRELAEENEDLSDQLDESRRSTTLCIRVMSDLIGEMYPDGITAAKGSEDADASQAEDTAT